MKKQSTSTKNKQLLEQYRRERRRINQLIRRAEKRGFIIPKSAKPGKPLKRPTEKSVERLKAITPEAIYARAKYKSQGKTYKGEEARKIARKEARKQTAKKKAEQAKSKAEQAAREEAEKIFNIEITELAKSEEKPTIEPPKEPPSKEPPKEADIIIHNVEEALPEPDEEDIFEVGYGEGAVMEVEEELESWERPLNSSDWYAERKEKDKNKMSRLFHEVLERDGVDAVAKRIRDSGERFKQLLDRILYGSGEEDLERDFAEMAAILYGRPLTVDESLAVTWWGE